MVHVFTATGCGFSKPGQHALMHGPKHKYKLNVESWAYAAAIMSTVITIHQILEVQKNPLSLHTKSNTWLNNKAKAFITMVTTSLILYV